LALEKMLEIDGAYVLYTAPSYTELSGRETEAQQFFAPLGATYKQGQIKLGRSTLVLQGICRADGLRGISFTALSVMSGLTARMLKTIGILS